jgi:hypothetical protein
MTADTNSDYVTHCFSRQQWLSERASMLWFLMENTSVYIKVETGLYVSYACS